MNNHIKELYLSIKNIIDAIEKERYNLDNIRLSMTQLNKQIESLYSNYSNSIPEGITCLIHLMYEINKELKTKVLIQEDQEMSPGIHCEFRGIGIEDGPGCFLCDIKKESLYNNISCFVRSKAAGEQITKMAPESFWLDYREYDPNWIQVKMYACDKHLPQLKELAARINMFDLFRSEYLTEVINNTKGASNDN